MFGASIIDNIISNSVVNFFNNENANSYFKDTLSYYKDVLIDLGIKENSILVLFEGEVQNQFPEYPLAFIWVFNTKDNLQRYNSGLVSDTYEFYVLEIFDKDIEITFSMREQFKRILLKNPTFTSHDGLNCKVNLLGTEPNLIGEQRIKSNMFFIKIDYKLDGRKNIKEYPINNIEAKARFHLEDN